MAAKRRTLFCAPSKTNCGVRIIVPWEDRTPGFYRVWKEARSKLSLNDMAKFADLTRSISLLFWYRRYLDDEMADFIRKCGFSRVDVGVYVKTPSPEQETAATEWYQDFYKNYGPLYSGYVTDLFQRTSNAVEVNLLGQDGRSLDEVKRSMEEIQRQASVPGRVVWCTINSKQKALLRYLEQIGMKVLFQWTHNRNSNRKIKGFYTLT